MDKRLDSTWWALRIAYGLVPLLAGLDKFFNLLANWSAYLNPAFLRILPISAGTFMAIVGVVEIAVGLAILTGFTRIGAYVAAAWLVAIAINLVSTGKYFDIAVRDLTMSLGAYALARLTEVREGATSRAAHREGAGAQFAHPARA